MNSLLITYNNPLFASFNYVEIQRKYELLYDSKNLYNRLDREFEYALCYPYNSLCLYLILEEWQFEIFLKRF